MKIFLYYIEKIIFTTINKIISFHKFYFLNKYIFFSKYYINKIFYFFILNLIIKFDKIYK